MRAVEDERERAGWDDFVALHPQSSLYHEGAWRQIFTQGFGYRSWYLLAQDESGKVLGCLPLFLVASPFKKRLVSVPFRDRGGVLWKTPEAFEALVTEAWRLARREKAAFLELKSISRYPQELVTAVELKENLYWVHSVVDLRGLDEAEFWRRLKSKTRNMVRQAERAGLSFHQVEARKALDCWFNIYLRSQKNLGVPPLPRHFFESLLTELGPSRARVYAVTKASQPVAATVILFHRHTATYAYSASLPQARPLRPNDLMLSHLINELLRQGVECLDLGSDAPSQESLLFFKRKWLATQTPIPVYSLGQVDAAVADSSHPRYLLARNILRQLPTWLLSWLGRWTARYFG